MRFFLTAMFSTCFVALIIAQSPKPYSILDNFIPSGYMGDTKNIRLVKNYSDNSRPDSLCTKITYQPGSEGWAGVSWQFPANNWCTKKGKDFSGVGYTTVTFWVRGENGGEEIKFKSGQDCGDTYSTDEMTKILGKSWTKVTIDLKGQNLSNVTGAFIWVADGKASPGTITFYVDDVQYE